MSKKKDSKTDNMFTIPNSTLKTLKTAKERIQKADEKYLDPKRLKIQTIEDYYKEVGIKQDPNGPADSHIGEYPDLFGIKLKKEEKNDIYCLTPGLESHSSVKLYAALLTANMEIKRKKIIEELDVRQDVLSDEEDSKDTE